MRNWNWARNLTVAGVVLGLIGAWFIGYSVIDKFEAREYGDVGFGGRVARTPEYDRWAHANDKRTAWGLGFITVAGLLRIFALYIPPPP